MKKIIYLFLGHLCLALGIVGAFLPVLPTTPFLLLAAFLYSKSNHKLHQWLLNHKYFGSSLRDWEENGVIRIYPKIIASVMLILIMTLRIPTLKIHLGIKIFAILILVGVLIFILSRPSKRTNQDNSKH
jgi:uncharacterized membrane protein YbaN (DUF454 family)